MLSINLVNNGGKPRKRDLTHLNIAAPGPSGLTSTHLTGAFHQGIARYPMLKCPYLAAWDPVHTLREVKSDSLLCYAKWSSLFALHRTTVNKNLIFNNTSCYALQSRNAIHSDAVHCIVTCNNATTTLKNNSILHCIACYASYALPCISLHCCALIAKPNNASLAMQSSKSCLAAAALCIGWWLRSPEIISCYYCWHRNNCC